jgi:hypothetical protein
MVVLEKRETQQISFFVRGLKVGGPADSSNLVNERVNYDELTGVDLAQWIDKRCQAFSGC